MDDALPVLTDAASRASGGSVAVVVTATGGARPSRASSLRYEELVEEVDRAVSRPRSAVEAAAVGGLYLDQKLLSRAHLSEDAIVSALRDMEINGEPVVEDVFPKLAVVFARYC
jgi:hypothetical protein